MSMIDVAGAMVIVVPRPYSRDPGDSTGWLLKTLAPNKLGTEQLSELTVKPLLISVYDS
jgi:hypothetical protein